MTDESTRLLDTLDTQIANKLEQKRSDLYYSGKRMEGYEEAILAVRSLIHDYKKASRMGRKWW